MKSFKTFLRENNQPRGNYIATRVMLTSLPLPEFNKNDFLADNIELYSENQRTIVVPPSQRHVCLMYSKNSSLEPGEVLNKLQLNLPNEIVARATNYELFDLDTNQNTASIGLVVESDFFVKAHGLLVDIGLRHKDFAFIPHICLLYNVNKRSAELLVKILNRENKNKVIDIFCRAYISNYIDETWHLTLPKSNTTLSP